MQYEIGYKTAHDYSHSSYGQTSDSTMYSPLKFIPWDGEESFEDLLRRKEAEFVSESERDNSEDFNHRFEVTHLKVKGKRSEVVHKIEKQVIKLDQISTNRKILA